MSLREKLIELLGGSAEDSDEEEPKEIVDECPAGGEHEWKSVQPATSRVPLFTYCTRCRQQQASETRS